MRKEVLLLAVAAMMVSVSLGHMDRHVDPWLDPVVSEGEMEAAVWVSENTPRESLFLAGIFGGELVMGMSGRASLVGGDWSANPDSPVQMSDVQEFYLTESPDEAEAIWRKYNASHAWFPSRRVYAGYGWINPNEGKMSDPRFELAYENSGVRIYRLRKSG